MDGTQRLMTRGLIAALLLTLIILVPVVRAATLTEDDKLTASDAAVIQDLFGHAVAVYGTTVVVAAPWQAHGDVPAPGAAYVFDCSSLPCTQISKLTASDGENHDRFGVSVAISGRTVVVGAKRDNLVERDEGSAYVFDLTTCGAACTEVSKLTASDAGRTDWFGVSVAVSGTTAMVGTYWDGPGNLEGAGSAYVFDLTTCGAACTEVSKLTASDAEKSDHFGQTLAVNGTMALIGAPNHDHMGMGAAGAAYIFDLTTCEATCTETRKLTASDAQPSERFGQTVALSGTTAVVSKQSERENGVASVGSIYVFDLATCGTPCGEVNKLTASDAEWGDDFGEALAISGTTVVVGAHSGSDTGSRSGYAYVFDLATCGATCNETNKLTASDAAEDDHFGYSVAVSGSTAVIGADLDDHSGVS